MDILKQLLLQLFLILLNAFFAATEIALLSLNEKKVRLQAEEGNKKAKRMLHIIEEPTKFLSAIQVGITLAGFLGSAFAADNFAERLCGFFIRVFSLDPASADVVETVSVIIITLILSYFTLVLGELVPKRLAMKYKEKLAGAVCGMMTFLTTALHPVIWFLTVSTNAVLRLFGIDPHAKEEAVSEEDIVIMLDAGADEGTIDKNDLDYIKGVFKLDHLTAAEVMTQRSALVAVPENIGDAELIDIIKTEGYSRIPVYRENMDHIVGIFHVKEYLLHRDDPDFQLSSIFMPPVFVPETMHLDLLLKQMQEERVHMVVVISEYGAVSGVVTMEDVVEEILGEIWDEQDEVIEFFRPLDGNRYAVDGSVTIGDLCEFFDVKAETEIVTFGGLFAELLDKVPEVGDHVVFAGLDMTVTEMDTHRITKLEVFPLESSDKTDEEENNA